MTLSKVLFSSHSNSECNAVNEASGKLHCLLLVHCDAPLIPSF